MALFKKVEETFTKVLKTGTIMLSNKRECIVYPIGLKQKKVKPCELEQFPLESLPNELILHIIKFLNMKDVVSISKTCPNLIKKIST